MTIEALQPTNHQLIILSHAAPFWGWHIAFLFGALLFGSVSLATYLDFWPLSVLNRYRTDLWRNKYLSPKAAKFNRFFSFIAFGFGSLVFFVVWISSVGQSYKTTLDRDKNAVSRVSVFFGDEMVTDSVGLDQIKDAEIQFGRAGAARLVFITRDGKEFIPLSSGYDDAQGYYKARDAVNDFLRPSKAILHQ